MALYSYGPVYLWPFIRARKYLTVTAAYGTCTMLWLTTTCPETLIVTLGDVLESGNAKNRVNLTCSVCAGCGDEVLCGAEMPFLDVCKWVRVNERKTAKSCTQIQGKWSSRSTFSPTMQKTRWISFSDRVGVQTQVHLKSWERGIHDQHSLTQLDQKGIEYYYRVDCITTHMSLSNSRALTWVCMSILFWMKLG